MKRVFVDTGAFFGLLVAQDAQHSRAKELFSQAEEDDWSLVTTNVVVFETQALLVSRVRDGRRFALAFLERIDEGLSSVERITEDDEANATALFRSHDDKLYSLVDALSFVVMERLGIEDAIAFDRHFRSYGKIRML